MAVSRSETVEVNGSSFLDTVDAHIDHAMQYLTLTDGLATRIHLQSHKTMLQNHYSNRLVLNTWVNCPE